MLALEINQLPLNFHAYENFSNLKWTQKDCLNNSRNRRDDFVDWYIKSNFVELICEISS